MCSNSQIFSVLTPAGFTAPRVTEKLPRTCLSYWNGGYLSAMTCRYCRPPAKRSRLCCRENGPSRSLFSLDAPILDKFSVISDISTPWMPLSHLFRISCSSANRDRWELPHGRRRQTKDINHSERGCCYSKLMGVIEEE